jgi:hypothetical protein
MQPDMVVEVIGRIFATTQLQLLQTQLSHDGKHTPLQKTVLVTRAADQTGQNIHLHNLHTAAPQTQLDNHQWEQAYQEKKAQ